MFRLGTLGGFLGGGMIAGTAISIAVPGVVGALSGYGCYKLFKRRKKMIAENLPYSNG